MQKKTAKKVVTEIPADKLSPQDDLIFSLDIGTRTIVGVVGEAVDDIFTVRDFHVEAHTKRAMIDGQIEDIKQVAKVASKVKHALEQKTGTALSKVSIAAAGRALKTKQISKEFDVSERDGITSDMIKSMEIETVQKAQAELDEEYQEQGLLFYCVGYSVTKYSLDDYKLVNLEGHKGNKVEIELIATFLPNAVVDGLYSVMDICGLEVSSLTLEPIAAMNVIVPPEIRLINIALVDIGAGTSDIAIAKDGTITAYAMATIAGDEITEEIIRAFFVDFATAEEMKQKSTSGTEEFTYRDIFGITQKVKTDEFNKKIASAVDSLAKTICEHIIEVNKTPPAAVFLVGGGSLVGGLSKMVAARFELDENRVAIGKSENFRTVDTAQFMLGAEYVTPVGIGVTSILNKGYDFSVITLNDEKVRVFDTRKISVYDLLALAGYKAHEIMGRSGRSLTFTLFGKHRTIKGGNFTPAEVYINGEAAPLTAAVTQGDNVKFVPAVPGETPSVKLGEICSASEKGAVVLGDTRYEIGTEFFVRGERVDLNYDIQPLDIIESGGIKTLGDLLDFAGINFRDNNEMFIVDGNEVSPDYVLMDGDIIDFPENTDGLLFKKNITEVKTEEILNPVSEIGEIKINLNGNDIVLPATSGGEHTFIELLNYADLDTENNSGNYIMTLNGGDTNFNTIIKDGDTAIIKWE